MTTKKSKASRLLEEIAGEALNFSNMMASTRKGMALTQEEFGKLLGIKRSYVCDIEKGRAEVSIQQAAKFAEALGKSKLVFVQLALEEQLKRSGLNFDVKLSDKEAS